jgi:hypothetical protein
MRKKKILNGVERGFYYVMRNYSGITVDKQLLRVMSRRLPRQEAVDYKEFLESQHPEYEFYLTYVENE